MAIIYGCTNFSSVNYNSSATVDDGSCIITGNKHHNITGVLTQELLTAGSNANINSISLINVHASGVTCTVDLYVEKQLTGKFYIFKTVSLPAGVALVHDIVGLRDVIGEFGLFIKIAAASGTPAVDVILS
jgi:hypothetical protein